MTRTTKAELRRKLDAAHKAKSTAEHELFAAKIKLESLGFERTEGPHEVFGFSVAPEIKWVKTEEALAAEKEAERERIQTLQEERLEFVRAIRAEGEKGVEKGREEALTKVIEALELTDYDTTRSYPSFDVFIKTPTPPPGPQPDKLWADLNTTLEAREAQKHAETVAATRKRVEDIGRRNFQPGDTISFFVPNLGDFIEGTHVGIDLAGEEPRPEKAPQGLVGDVAKTAKKAKKKGGSK